MIYVLLFMAMISNAVADTRTKVAVIDTGVFITKEIKPFLCDSGHRDLTNTDLTDKHGHGTNVAHLIARGLDPNKQCLLILKWVSNNQESTPGNTLSSRIADAVAIAVLQGAKYINLSLSGNDINYQEYFSILRALSVGTVITVAAGNDSVNLSHSCSAFPACYKIKDPNYFIVANYHNNERVWTSNYSGPVNAKEDGYNQSGGGVTLTGTSQSSAIFMGKLIHDRENKNENRSPNSCNDFTCRLPSKIKTRSIR